MAENREQLPIAFSGVNDADLQVKLEELYKDWLREIPGYARARASIGKRVSSSREHAHSAMLKAIKQFTEKALEQVKAHYTTRSLVPKSDISNILGQIIYNMKENLFSVAEGSIHADAEQMDNEYFMQFEIDTSRTPSLEFLQARVRDLCPPHADKSISKKKLGHKGVPVTLQEYKRWEEVVINFVNEEDVAIYSIGENKRKKYNFAEFGFKNSITGKPNKQWELLRDISLSGPLRWGEKTKSMAHQEAEVKRSTRPMDSWDDDEEADNSTDKHDTVNIVYTSECANELKQRMRELNKTLKAVFPNIEGNPFHRYQKVKGWVPRFQLRG
jgi:hypothetical protein